MYNREKTQAQLDKVQAGCRSRLLTTDFIEQQIASCEAWLADRKLPSEVQKHVTYHYVETVPNSYKASADATHMSMSFTTKGKVKDVEIERSYTQHEPYGGAVSRFNLCASKLFEEEYDLYFYTTNEKQRKAMRHLVRSWGFNPGTLYAQL